MHIVTCRAEGVSVHFSPSGTIAVPSAEATLPSRSETRYLCPSRPGVCFAARTSLSLAVSLFSYSKRDSFEHFLREGASDLTFFKIGLVRRAGIAESDRILR